MSDEELSVETCQECGHSLENKLTRDDPFGAYYYCRNSNCQRFGKKQADLLDPDAPPTIYDDYM